MGVNGSELINNPWNTTMSPWTDLFSPFSGMFYLIIVLVLAAALYVKSRNPAGVSAFIIGAGALLSAADMFSGYSMMGGFMVVVVVMGFVGLIASLYFMKK